MREPACVGALIRDEQHRVFAQRRSPSRRLLPGIWDIVGGHVEPGETPEETLAREITEETGWRLRTIEGVIADWEWEWDGETRRELDYLVTVTGDLAAPRLEEGKHDAYAWVGPDDLDLMMRGRTDGDRRLRDVVAKAVRVRLTARLRLEPIGPEHVDALWKLHQDEVVAHWYAESWSREKARGRAADYARAWESDGVAKWMAYDRTSGEAVGRGGLSRMAAEDDLTRQISALLPDGRWSEHRLELGWALRSEFHGQGLATEIGRAGLAFAFGDLGADVVVAFTERHNHASRAVMERLAMRPVGEITGPGLVEGRDGVHDGARFAVYAATR